MTIKNSAHSTWTGDIKSGNGGINTKSGALDNQPFGFKTAWFGAGVKSVEYDGIVFERVKP